MTRLKNIYIDNIINVSGQYGSHIHDAIKDCKQLAAMLNTTIILDFNGIKLTITSVSNEQKLLTKYFGAQNGQRST